MRTEKKFDAVKMMRRIRDKLSREIINMSYDEQKEYIRERVKARFKTAQDNEEVTHTG